MNSSYFTLILTIISVFGPLYGEVKLFVPIVVSKFSHNPESFTQGLAVEGEQLFESTGLYGKSTLQCLNLLTGQIEQKKKLSSTIFGEGIAVFPNQIIQITWREKKAFVYVRPSLQLSHILTYSGEGWGLCREGNTVWMSNGTSILTQRDLISFEPLKTLHVKLEGKPVERLNDLEWDGSFLYANVFMSNLIFQIDKLTGDVTGIVDASNLLSSNEKAVLDSSKVLNGIAYNPKTRTFFITGKCWPWIFEVRFSK